MILNGISIINLRSAIYYFTDYYEQPVIIVFWLNFGCVLAIIFGAILSVKYDNLKILMNS